MTATGTPASNRVVAIVPMRHDSKRVLGKNYRKLDGKPLIIDIIATLRAAAGVSQIVIDTDSDQILGQRRAKLPRDSPAATTQAARRRHGVRA